MWLSKNFSLAELTYSEIAMRHGIPNIPDARVIENLKILCTKVLQPLRNKFGPVRINSGFRNIQVNSLVGSQFTSHHLSGYAADLEVPGYSNALIAEYIRDNLDFTRCILEFYTPGIPDSGWVHVSYIEPHLDQLCFTIYREDGKKCTVPGLII